MPSTPTRSLRRSRLYRLTSPISAAALSVTLIFGSAVAADEPVLHPVLNYQGNSYQQQSLPSSIQSDLYELEQQHNQKRQEAFDNYIVNRYVREEAERQQKTFQQVQQQLLGAPIPSQQQIEAFYKANKARIPGTLPQVSGEISKYLKSQAMVQKQQQLLTVIAEQQGYKVEFPALPLLRLPIKLDGYPTKGNSQAKVTLVEFADYQCPHCKDAGPQVKKVLEKYPDQVRLVFRDFPINRSGISKKMAEAAVCADQQEMYWPYHELAFARQSYLKTVTPDMLADELGLDMDAFNACISSGQGQTQVAESLAEARELGLTSTPSFFVNGRPLPHLHGDLAEQISALVDEELKAK
ncbi:MAG: DsbA family protein [Motiliproteus sp.]